MSEMQAMIQEARDKGMWLHCSYQDLWFTPDELEKAQATGKFCWGPVNWTLRSPAEREAEILGRQSAINTELSRHRERVSK